MSQVKSVGPYEWTYDYHILHLLAFRLWTKSQLRHFVMLHNIFDNSHSSLDQRKWDLAFRRVAAEKVNSHGHFTFKPELQAALDLENYPYPEPKHRRTVLRRLLGSTPSPRQAGSKSHRESDQGKVMTKRPRSASQEEVAPNKKSKTSMQSLGETSAPAWTAANVVTTTSVPVSSDGVWMAKRSKVPETRGIEPSAPNPVHVSESGTSLGLLFTPSPTHTTSDSMSAQQAVDPIARSSSVVDTHETPLTPDSSRSAQRPIQQGSCPESEEPGSVSPVPALRFELDNSQEELAEGVEAYSTPSSDLNKMIEEEFNPEDPSVLDNGDTNYRLITQHFQTALLRAAKDEARRYRDIIGGLIDKANAEKKRQIKALASSNATKDEQIRSLTAENAALVAINANKDEQIQTLVATNVAKGDQLKTATAADATKDERARILTAENADKHRQIQDLQEKVQAMEGSVAAWINEDKRRAQEEMSTFQKRQQQWAG